MDDSKKRNRTPQTFPLDQRLIAEIEKLREQVASLPHGPRREEILRKIRQHETALHMTDWLRSPGLKPPT
jgi:transcriptional accessory protein Tex/SPT6